MVVFIFVIVAGFAIAAVSVITMLRRRARRAVHSPIPLIIPLAPSIPAANPWPQQMQTPEQPSDLRQAVAQTQTAPETWRSETSPSTVASSELEASPTVRFRRPTDDAVQLLPGRLEVLAGESHHKEIRFVRTPGERPEIILGRDVGDGPGHVALHSTTVSRQHARFAYENRQWKVANLSQTNPLVVNDEALLVSHGERPLADGDRLELGEVVLRFHADSK
jgi:hypothetical protein